jgi:hypothetical protein
MRRAISWLAVLALPAAVLLGSPAHAQKKKGAVDKDLDDKNSEKMIKAGVLVGRVSNIYESSRKIQLKVAVPITTLDAGAVSGMQQAQVAMAMARARRDVVGMRQAQLELLLNQARLYKVDVRTVDVEVEALDDVVVRTARPKADFDDKGRPKKLTKAQLKELRGDPKEPGYNLGYKAEFGDVAADQIVKVQLVRKKGEAPAAKAKPKLKAKPKGKKAKAKDDEIGPADVLGDNAPQVSMIIILGEAAGGR